MSALAVRGRASSMIPAAGDPMNECPYCYTKVGVTDTTCPNCGRKIEQWQTGFYTRQPLPNRTRTAVWIVAAIALILVVGGFARSCHWI